MAEFTCLTASVSEAGGRVSEDRSAILDLGTAILLVVADGAGGRGAGARAAEHAVQEISRQALADVGRARAPGFWAGILCDIDQDLMSSRQGGETTAVIAAVSAQGVAGVSIGDSAAWLVTSDGYEDLTWRQETKLRLGCADCGPAPFSSASAGTLIVMSDGLWRYARPQ